MSVTKISFMKDVKKISMKLKRLRPNLSIWKKNHQQKKKAGIAWRSYPFFEASIAESILMVNLEELISKTYKEL